LWVGVGVWWSVHLVLSALFRYGCGVCVFGVFSTDRWRWGLGAVGSQCAGCCFLVRAGVGASVVSDLGAFVGYCGWASLCCGLVSVSSWWLQVGGVVGVVVFGVVGFFLFGGGCCGRCVAPGWVELSVLAWSCLWSGAVCEDLLVPALCSWAVQHTLLLGGVVFVVCCMGSVLRDTGLGKGFPGVCAVIRRAVALWLAALCPCSFCRARVARSGCCVRWAWVRTHRG